MVIIDNNNLLTDAQSKLLRNYAQKPFTLGKYRSLDEILTELNVEVHIEPGIIERETPSVLDQIENYWKEVLDRFSKESDPGSKEVKDRLKYINEQFEYWRSMRLRGLYDSKDNVIKLFPEVMATEYDGEKMNELLVSTLAHETMHAYFNRPGHESYPYVIFIEEPLAEFGMLLYLFNTDRSFYEWAFKDVSDKKTCYSHGAMLMSRLLEEGTPSPTRAYLEEYKVLLEYYLMIDDYAMGRVKPGNKTNTHFPQTSVFPQTLVDSNGKSHTAQWKELFEIPPRYSYDASKKELVLDGEWPKETPELDATGRLLIHGNIIIRPKGKIETIVLGDNFQGQIPLLKEIEEIAVSEKNNLFSSDNLDKIKGIPVYKKDRTPALPKCGEGLYKICRKYKWGIIGVENGKLKEICPCKYDVIYGYFDSNNFIKVGNIYEYGFVSKDGKIKYGLVSKDGKVKVELEYDDISINKDGTYTVEQGDNEIIIDKDGNRIDKE